MGDAERYARHAYFMIAEMTDNFIPSDQQPQFLADISYWLAVSIFRLAEDGGIPPEKMQKAGEEAIAHARKALELQTQLRGTEDVFVADAMNGLAVVLNFFNIFEDNEKIRLMDQSNAIFLRIEGSLSVNVAVGEGKLGTLYGDMARRQLANNDLDLCVVTLELALTHFGEALRICRLNNHVEVANDVLRNIAHVKEDMRKVGIARAAA